MDCAAIAKPMPGRVFPKIPPEHHARKAYLISTEMTVPFDAFST